jgi:NTP pyrophosphatase (non-canonical NTP hydrolase)
MDMKEFSRENRTRCEAPTGFNHSLDGWTLSDWMVATSGELGEAANVLKKLNRIRDGIAARKQSETEAELRAKFALELADVYIYLDLMAQAAGIDLAAAIREAFDAKSKMIGYAEA